MAATHTKDDLKLLLSSYHYNDAPPEAFGYCGVCFGSGEEQAIDYILDGRGPKYEGCGFCGGDGLSTLIENTKLEGICQES